MAVKDANDTSVYETQSGSKIIIGRAARARADLIKKFREQNENSTTLETRHRQGRIVNNNVALSPESRIVNDPEAYAHIPAFGGIPQGGFQPIEVRLPDRFRFPLFATWISSKSEEAKSVSVLSILPPSCRMQVNGTSTGKSRPTSGLRVSVEKISERPKG